MGFDPRRQHKRSWLDYVYVAAAVVVFFALLAWALFG